ncbi:MAG: nucleotidyltransferase family protein [Chloroflexota bacterium]|nr:nucleotidyltransferase family protein [Chloroflexota bacterium]
MKSDPAKNSVAGIVLAAGGASRFGEPKQLLLWHGRALVWHVADKAVEAGLSPVIVVGGDYMESLRSSLAGLAVSLIHNPHWKQGQSTSVRAGVGAVPASGMGAMLLLADQPQIPVTLIRKLMQIHASDGAPIVAPRVQNQRANPVLFDRVVFDDLMKLSGDIGGRKLFSKYKPEWVTWHDTSILLDVDTREDYRELLDLDE